MTLPGRAVALIQIVLIAPSALFMGALSARGLKTPERAAASDANHVVMWFADRPWTLWTLLFALPILVLILGSLALIRSWRETLMAPTPQRPSLSTRIENACITAAMLTAGGILGVVTAHMLMPSR